ncbi:MAG: 50S ribosomal protein L31 [Alphaproteobacteria bacterium]|nr:50S ribosomal protein L31 [Alphaproteobacteria bacterium]
MKANIHPDYHEITVVLTDGSEYKTRTTWGKQGDVMRLDIDSLSHPAWKGGVTKITEKGQLSKFEKRFGSFLSVGVQTAGRSESAPVEAEAEASAAAPAAPAANDKAAAGKKAGEKTDKKPTDKAKKK